MAGEDPFEAVQRKVIGVLRGHDLGEEPRSRPALLDGPDRWVGDDHAVLALAARVLATHVLEDEEARWDVLQFLARLLADPRLRFPAARAHQVGGIRLVLDPLPGQVLRKRCPSVATLALAPRLEHILVVRRHVLRRRRIDLVLGKRQGQLIGRKTLRPRAVQETQDLLQAVLELLDDALRGGQLIEELPFLFLELGDLLGGVIGVHAEREHIADSCTSLFSPHILRLRIPPGTPVVPSPAPRLAKVDPAQEQRQFLAAELHRRRRAWPGERPSLQPLGEHPESRAVPHEDLHEVTATVAENEDVAAQRILSDHLTRRPGEAVERLAHVRGAGGQEDADRRGQRQHAEASVETRP